MCTVRPEPPTYRRESQYTVYPEHPYKSDTGRTRMKGSQGRREKREDREGRLRAWLTSGRPASHNTRGSANQRLPQDQPQEDTPKQPMRGEPSHVGRTRYGTPAHSNEGAEDDGST